MPIKPINPMSDVTFHSDAQAGTWTATPIDGDEVLDDPLPDFCLQLRDIEQGHPPCVGGEVRANIEGAIRAAFATDFPGAYVDSACVGAGRPEGEALALGVWTLPPNPLSDDKHDAMHAALTRSIDREADQNIAFFIHTRLFRQLAARTWKPKLVDDQGIEQLNGYVHLNDLEVSMLPPAMVVTTVTGYDERPLPDADFTVTIAENLRVEAGSIVSSPTRRINVDTTLNDLLTLGSLGLLFVNPLLFLPIVALGIYQSWELRHASAPESSGAGSIIAARLLPPAIPVAGGMKHVVGYTGHLVVRPHGVFVGGVVRPKEPRTPSVALVGPSEITSAMGQAIVPGHFRAEVDDLRGPLTYAWSSDGEVQVREWDAEVVVRFDAPASGKSRFGQVSVTITDADMMVVSATRRVQISTPAHQGPGGHGQGGGGSNNPQSEP
jgi:hypothetical protein